MLNRTAVANGADPVQQQAASDARLLQEADDFEDDRADDEDDEDEDPEF